MLYAPNRPMSEVDLSLLWSAVALLAIGFVMVYSASIATAEMSRLTGYRSHYYLMRQGMFITIGVMAAVIAFQIPVAWLQRGAPFLFLFCILMLLLVLIPGIGVTVNGSRRWLPLGITNFQPSELMKLAVVLYAADYTVRKAAFMQDFKRGFLPMFGVMFLAGGLLLMQPDFGAFVVITTIAMGILFLGGLNWRLFAGLIVLLLCAFVALILLSPYRLQRVLGFMDPWADAFGKGYQLSHSLIAFGRGEWFGVGLGASVEKLFYLPEAHTDFLMAVIAEELGLLGVLAVIGLFVWLVWRAFLIGRQSASLERYFAALVAQGIALWVSVQAFINMGVNMGLLPTKGLTLPFLSYGGTGIVINCVAVAVLLRIDFENRALMSGRRK
ncbi:MAG: putative lipid II flippase FtsW [Burkholderiales bacterium]|nr:putative lipid II flippase FtsW [Burkholderiales bacterium]